MSDFQYGAILAASPWQMVLAPTSVTMNWFLRKRQTLGDGIFILKYIISPLIMARIVALIAFEWATFEIIDDSTMHEIDVFLIVFIVVITIIFIGILWNDYPQYEDHFDAFYIRYELKLIFVYSIAAHSIVVPVNVATVWFGIPIYWVHVTQQMMLCGFLWIMIVWPKWKIRTQSHALSQYLAISFEKKAALTPREMWMKEVSTKKGYEGFACFLAKEFALEVIIQNIPSRIWLKCYSNLTFMFFVIMNSACCLSPSTCS